LKKYLNTLFVTTSGAYLHKEGETVVVKVEGEIKLQLPVHTLDGIVCFGNVACSPYLMGFCAENHVALSFLSEYGRFLAAVRGEVSGNVLLRREQYRKADDPAFCAKVVKNILTGKLANTRTVLRRAVRDHGEKIPRHELDAAANRISGVIDRLQNYDGMDALRGLEGEGGRYYFSVFDYLIVNQKEDFKFGERSRRPPLDEVNCLLSFLYTLMVHDMGSALEAVGLDPCVGFLHTDRPGRSGLALDLMEELRAFLADRLVLTLINREQVRKKGFNRSESGAVTMDDETRKTVLVAYQNRKLEEISHPYLGETMPVGLLFYIQAMLFARFLRGDLDGYPVFLWK
jgi:CRISPR-associated protein Cas1